MMLKNLFLLIILSVVVFLVQREPSAQSVCVMYDIYSTWDETRQEHVFDYTCAEYRNG